MIKRGRWMNLRTMDIMAGFINICRLPMRQTEGGDK